MSDSSFKCKCAIKITTFERETFKQCAWDMDSIVPSLARILTKQHGIRGAGEYVPLENPWKCHFRDSKFQNVATCPDPQEFVPWCEFQSRQLLIIICLLLNTFRQPFSQVQVLDVCTTAVWIPKNIHSYWVLMKLFWYFFQVWPWCTSLVAYWVFYWF